MSKDKQKEIQENELVSWGEEKLGHLKPYARQIGLFVALVLIGFMAITWLIGTQREKYSLQWRELHLASTETNLTQNSSRLLDVAESFPDQRAGVWSLQMAGDYDMRTGLSQLSYDREGGLALIRRAKDNYAKVVEAEAQIKSKDLQERSLFSLAYAHESLGEFDQAKDFYSKLVEASPDSPFSPPSQRGIERCSSDDLVALYSRFKDWKIEEEEAPGAPTPDRPDINFPGIDDTESAAGDNTESLGIDGGSFEGGKDETPPNADGNNAEGDSNDGTSQSDAAGQDAANEDDKSEADDKDETAGQGEDN